MGLNRTTSIVATCLNNCELLETQWEYFLQKLSLLLEGHSTLNKIILYLLKHDFVAYIIW